VSSTDKKADSRLILTVNLNGRTLREAVQVCAQDADVTANQITARDGRGFKDRVTALPEAIMPPVRHGPKEGKATMRTRSLLLLVSALVAALYAQGYSGEVATISFPRENDGAVQTLGKVRELDVNVNPSIPSYEVRPDLSNVIGHESLSALSHPHRALLAENGFCILTSGKLDMYELYEPNPSPFVTADCVFHAYYVLLADTLKNLEEAYMVGELSRLVAGAHRHAQALLKASPKPLEPAAKKAVVFYAVAHRLLDPSAPVDGSVKEEVDGELARILEARFVGRLPGQQYTRDYTVYQPSAGYSNSETLQRYFRAHKYLSLTPVPFQTPEEVQTCVLASACVWENREARSAYSNLRRIAQFLSGAPEDPTPLQVLEQARRLLGESMPLARLADEECVLQLRERLRALPKPAVADQPQEKPGADPLHRWGMRILSAGVTIRARAFQRLGERTLDPSGQHIAYVLGNRGVEITDVEKQLLKPVKTRFEAAASAAAEAADIHTASLAILSKLNIADGQEYPQFMRGPAWSIKTASTQMAAWSQIEHAVYLYAKDTAYYTGMYGRETGFHGYVEPVPTYYAVLWTLVHRTRTAFEELGVFDRIRGLRKEAKTEPFAELNIVATPKHYETLEDILLKLKSMSEKELENKPFDESEIALLKEFGLKLKYLAFNESNLPHAREPMGTIVRIAREYLKREGVYVGTGRPLVIYAIVPWMGNLHWTKGAVYSYYEFKRPLVQPLDDEQWKHDVMAAYAAQPHRPWIFEKGVGVDPVVWSEKEFSDWLPEEREAKHFGSGLGGPRVSQAASFIWTREEMDRLGYVSLSNGTLPAAGEAFARQRHDGEKTRTILYYWLKDAPPNIRKTYGLEAIQTIVANLESRIREVPPYDRQSVASYAAGSNDYSHWIYYALAFLREHAGDPEVIAAVKALLPILNRDKTRLTREILGDDATRELIELAQKQQATERGRPRRKSRY